MQPVAINKEDVTAAKENPVPYLVELALCKEQRNQAHDTILQLRVEIVFLNKKIAELQQPRTENQGQD